MIDWGGVLCAVRCDDETGAAFVIAVHSFALGPAAGGTRAMEYPSLDAAVLDATRLAEAMSLKLAVAGLPLGGGKSVIALPVPRARLDPARWRRILEIHAENVAAFGGNYVTGPDVGTTAADMDVVHECGAYATGRTPATGGSGSSAPATARGVHIAVKRAAAEAGFDELDGLTVLIQGLGAVGAEVARRVAADGARLIVADIDERAVTAAVRLGATAVPVEDVLQVESDLFVPCAIGGIIDADVAGTIRTKAIAGAANNVLTGGAAAEVLQGRGIVLAPDFIANVGGAVDLAGREFLGWGDVEVEQKLAEIGDTLDRVFADAATEHISTDEAARCLARRRLEALRTSR
nr:Glu/Leu/Phe/Val dehydrogenase dimerization domain-containing protein [Kribbella solani]